MLGKTQRKKFIYKIGRINPSEKVFQTAPNGINPLATEVFLDVSDFLRSIIS